MKLTFLKKIFNLKTAAVLAAVFAAVSAASALINGRTCTMAFELNGNDPGSAEFVLEQDTECVRETGRHAEDGVMYIDLEPAGNAGRAFVWSRTEGVTPVDGNMVNVHRSGVITADGPLGSYRGDGIVPYFMIALIAFVWMSLLVSYLISRRESIYQYKNAVYLAAMIYTGFLLLLQILLCFPYRGLDETLDSLLGASGIFTTISLPFAVILSLLVTGSNIVLVKKEGKSPKNMLAAALGAVICAGIIAPMIFSEIAQRSVAVDFHNLGGPWYYVEIFLRAAVSQTVAYLECLLAGTVVCDVIAAKHVPPYDRDWIAILGCQIRSDGTLTPLLRARVDRAVGFAEAQKKATGKDILFVPSGGRGPDEVMSEAAAMKNYLLSRGIPEEMIAVEEASTDTAENLAFSKKTAEERLLGAGTARAAGTAVGRPESEAGHEAGREAGAESVDVAVPEAGTAAVPGGAARELKAAFSTTNYHAFRAGWYAREAGFDAEGVGSPTKAYFWINASVREFIAAFANEIRRHLATVGLLTLAALLLTVLEYVSNR